MHLDSIKEDLLVLVEVYTLLSDILVLQSLLIKVQYVRIGILLTSYSKQTGAVNH